MDLIRVSDRHHGINTSTLVSHFKKLKFILCFLDKTKTSRIYRVLEEAPFIAYLHEVELYSYMLVRLVPR